MRRALALIGLSGGLLVFSPSGASACTCAPSGPPCQATWESPLIFAGTVIEVDQRPQALGPHRVRFRITEAFRGMEAGEVEIHLRGSGSASCDPEFKLGESWLVYGNNRWEGGPGWTTSICSRTRLLTDAAEDLAYLRLPDTLKPESHITGRVADFVYKPPPATGAELQGIADVPVVVASGSWRFETKTDSEGRYRIDVSSGTYDVSFGSVSGLDIRGRHSVSVPHHRSCAVADAYVRYEGSVTGQVVDARGLPVAYLPLQMASTLQRSLEHTMTDVTGRFEFPVRLPPPHDVAVSVDLWPTEPDVPSLTPQPLGNPEGGVLDAGQLRVPSAIRLALVEFLIVDSLGNPASGAHVVFKQPDIYNATSYDPSPEADANGRFLVSLVAGERYRIMVMHQRKTATDTVSEEADFTISATAGRPIRVRLEPWRY